MVSYWRHLWLMCFEFSKLIQIGEKNIFCQITKIENTSFNFSENIDFQKRLEDTIRIQYADWGKEEKNDISANFPTPSTKLHNYLTSYLGKFSKIMLEIFNLKTSTNIKILMHSQSLDQIYISRQKPRKYLCKNSANASK